MAAATVLTAAACSSSQPSSGGPTSNFGPATTLTIRTDGPWDTFDPASGANLPSFQLEQAVYDRLVGQDAHGKLIPYLATSWTQTPTTLKFVLKKGVTCSDGTPLNATAVSSSFDRLLGISNPKTKANTVLGEFGSGPFTVSADDAANTFTLGLGSPFADALSSIATGLDTMVICPRGLVPGALKDAAYGSGPYTIESEDRSSQITLKARSDWTWGPGGKTARTIPGTLVYKIVTNETTAANLLLTGGLDIARIQGVDVKRLLADRSLGQLTTTPHFTNPVWFNTQAGHPTADPVVRQALATAISPDAWNQAAYSGLGTVTTSLFAKNAPCYDAGTAQLVPKTDLSKAKSVLLGDGYTQDSSGKLVKNGQPLTIQLIGATEQGAGPEYLQTQFTQLGINVNFVDTDHVTYSASYLQPGKWDVIVPGIAGDVAGSYVLSYIGTPPPGGRNFSRIQDPSIDALVQKAEQSTGSQACSYWADVQTAWLKNYYVRPLVAQNFYWFSHDPRWSFQATTSVLSPQTLT